MERQIAKLVDDLKAGVPGAVLKDELTALDAARTELRRLLSVQDDTKPLLHPNMAQLYRTYVLDVRAALAEEGPTGDAAKAIRLMIDAILLTPNSEGKLDVLIRGDLAALLILANPEQASNTTPLSLVAGACNHLDLEFPWSVAELLAAS